MKELTNKNLNFTFYVNDWADHTCEKIRVYDSNKEMIDYLEEFSVLESCDYLQETPQDYIDAFAETLERAKTIRDFMNEFAYDYYVVEDDPENDLLNHLGEYTIEMF